MSDAGAAAAGETGPEPRGQGGPPVRGVFFGSGSFAVPILDALTAIPGIDVVTVVSAPDRPVGRGAVLTATPVAARAAELGLALHQPSSVRSPDSVAMLAALAPDLAILADYGQLIPRSLIDLPHRGFLNLHPSALPRHRGATPIPATILAGDSASAVTLLCLTEDLDAGPIVSAAELEVRPDDTSPVLEARAASVAAELLTRALPEWLAGRLKPRPQAGPATMTRPLRREDGRLDPIGDANTLERQVRAYQPWPGSFLETPAGRLIVWRATARQSQAGDPLAAEGGQRLAAEGGQRLVADEDGLALITASGGRLRLDEVQLAGKRRMTGAELRRGNPSLVDRAVRRQQTSFDAGPV